MMMNRFSRATFGLLSLASVLAVAPGCVSQRPARNGVFNENQYVRKDFLIRGGDGSGADPGWHLKATVTEVSTPDPLGDVFGIFAGSESGGALVRFVVTQDKLQMVNLREITNDPSPVRIPEVVNAWPVTNVDLKYRINLDGEKTNFYEENQELDWQVRQWVKINFAKNDLSDVAPLGDYTSDLLSLCTDIGNASATLVPDSFMTDEASNYMQWRVQIALPLKWTDPACVEAYGGLGDTAIRLGRNTVTFNLMYSLSRADASPAYKPLIVAEKDPIRHKYGPIEFTSINRDNTTGQLAAQQYVVRFDPEKPIVWYFAEGFPEKYKSVFLGPGGVKEQTNKLLADAGAKAQVDFKEYDAELDPGQLPREYGDVRYSFLRWVSDRDMQSYWAGVTQFVIDPRNGRSVSSSISFNDFAIKDYYVQRIDAYLQSIGAAAADKGGALGVNASGEWTDPGPCKDGDTMPIVPATLASNHNGNSSLFGKMQQYLQKPVAQYGNLGPHDFIAPHVDAKDPSKADDDFFRAYYALMPYYAYADPDVNQFVIPEGGSGVLGSEGIWKSLQAEAEFHALAAKIDHGEIPYDDMAGPNGLPNASAFLDKWRKLTVAHNDWMYKKNFIRKAQHMDTAESFSFEQVIARDARHCNNGKWETKQQWVDNLIDTYWSQVIWHEFGHALGLEHNFMASVDAPNYPRYQDKSGNEHIGLYASSVMEYNASPDRVFWHAGWAPYDQGSISWIYANAKPNAPAACTPDANDPTKMTCPEGQTCETTSNTCLGSSISGQVSDSVPWKDPHGFDSTGKEIQYLYCNETHLRYSPFCRQGDIGRTPSEIIANEIDSYEWQYKWRNYRQYRKIWDDSHYADGPAGIVTDMRKFMSLWIFDWSTSELADSLRRIGVKNPDPNGSDLEYFGQLTNKFNEDASAANQMVAAFHKAIIQQSSGERPYKTVYDKYYGDVTQQGIILDKLFAMQGWVGMWPTQNYDPNQAGFYIASYSGFGDSSYRYVAQDAVVSMIGGQYDVYPYFVPLAVAQYAMDTHDPSFSGNPAVRNFIGGHLFYRLEDFLTFFRDVAVQNNYIDPNGSDCTEFDTCKFDPRTISDTHNEFYGPDKRLWIWAYVPDRNMYVAVQKEYNTASYLTIRNYNDYLVYQLDDGAYPGGVFPAELQLKYVLDAFTYYN